jgi:hypothetical protein
MNQLPLELVHRILEYDGRIKYRNGKYMNQIDWDDDRYKMLKQMPQILPFKFEHNLSSFYYMTIYSFDTQCCFEKYDSGWSSETPYIFSYTTNEIGVYHFKKENICYKFMILRQAKPTLFSYISEYLYDLFRRII